MGLVLRIVVGGVFLVSGVLKLRAPDWPAQAAALGASRSAAIALPWVELALGASVVAGLGLPWTALALLALLAAFTAAITRRLAAGHHPPCACFGSWSTRPIGLRDLVRNSVLAAMTAALAVLYL